MPKLLSENSQLNDKVSALGRRYGFDTAIISFHAFKDFKVRWTRTPLWIDLELSDYLSDAPESVIMGLLETIMNRIRNSPADAEYPAEVLGYLRSQEFKDAHASVYIRRNRASDSEPELDSFRSALIDNGLIGENTRVVFYNSDDVGITEAFDVVFIPYDSKDDSVESVLWDVAVHTQNMEGRSPHWVESMEDRIDSANRYLDNVA